MKKQTEEALQNRCYVYLLENRRDLIMFQVPNEAIAKTASMFLPYKVPQTIVSKVSANAYAQFRNTGFLKGVSDTIIIAPNKVLFVEFKLPGEKQRPEQVTFQNRVTSLGHKYIVIYSLEEFKEVIKSI